MMKLPQQLYVTARPQNVWENGVIVSTGTPLGFLNAYEPGKAAFEKKRVTQEEWAYKGYSLNDFKLEKHGDEVWVTGWEWVRGAPIFQAGNKKQIAEPVHPQPQIWDNTPMRGFSIVKSVSRYSTSNKLWRILDPRGIEFEISTIVLEQIIQDATILKGGIIYAYCAWLRNKELVVVA